jgi:hypothetical protein
MNENKRNRLTEAELDDINNIVGDTLAALVGCADKHNIDRDSLVRYFAAMFKVMAEVSTFKHYNGGGNNDGE